MVTLQKNIEANDSFVRTLFVHMTNAERADKFFESWYPDALAIGDPRQMLYRAFEIKIGSVMQFFKPAVWKAYWNNRKFGIGSPGGNTMRNPGAVLVHHNQVLYQQTNAMHFGEQVDLEAVKARLQESN